MILLHSKRHIWLVLVVGMSSLIGVANASALSASSKPTTPEIQLISSSAKSSKGTVDVTVDFSIANTNRKSPILQTQVKVGAKTCTANRTATSCTVKAVAAGKTYKVLVRAKNRNGYSAWSSSISFVASSGSSLNRSVITTPSSVITTTTTDVYAVPAGYFRPTCGSGVGECPKVDAKRRADECKIADATPGDVSQGFPRPPKAKQGKSMISILVVPVRYGEDPITEEMVRKQYESEFEKEKEFFKRNSYSRVEVVFTLEPKSQWVQVSETSEVFVSQRGSDLRRVTQDLVQLIPRNDPGKFDGVIFVVAGDGISFGGMDQSATYTHSSGILQTVYLTIGKLRSGLHLDHNLGHTAYYLEDLYLFDRYRTSTSENFPMRYDVMGAGGEDFSAWNRWLAGFLLDTEVVCIDSSFSESSIYLNHINLDSGDKIAVIPLSYGRGLILEYINKLVHIYELNSWIGHGAGPMKTIATIDKVGNSVTYDNYTITISAADQTGVFAKISK